ncbi:MAG: DUF615 domain-containing protein [Halioglobus sp.]|nr:DUF615 domain-containing protein [Halioglobus sp.]
MNSKPSKSSRKRDAQNVLALGERLLELTDQQLAEMPLDSDVRALVVSSRNIRSHSALRRQRLYLAKVLRNADLDELQAAVNALDIDQRTERQLFHQAERWRDRLLNEGEPALLEFDAAYGRKHEELARLLRDLRPNLPEAVSRRLGRGIFRQIHSDLSAAFQKG